MMNTVYNKIKSVLVALNLDCLPLLDTNKAVLLLALTALGVLGNHLNIELFFGVNFLFGSIATMITVRATGTLWGTVVGIAVGSYTYFLWGHPYAICIFGLEALIVGFLINKLKSDNLIVADIVYWLVIGAPLVWVFYTYSLGLPESAVSMIAVKQTINGIANVALANILIQMTPIGRRIIGKYIHKTTNWSLGSAINNTIAVFILIPMLGSMIISNIDELEEIQEMLDHHVTDGARQGVTAVQTTLHSYTTILNSLIASDFKENELLEWSAIIKKWEQNILPSL